MLGLRFCARAFSSCGERGPLFIAVRGPLTVAASLVAEHRLQTRRLSNCGSRAQLLRGMWDLPRPGLEPMSPALAGGFLTTAPPGKPTLNFYPLIIFLFLSYILSQLQSSDDRSTKTRSSSKSWKFLQLTPMLNGKLVLHLSGITTPAPNAIRSILGKRPPLGARHHGSPRWISR